MWCDCGYNFDTGKMKSGYEKKRSLFENFFEMGVPFKFRFSELPIAARKATGWLTMNLICLIVYLYFSLSCAPTSYEGGLIETTSTGISWVLTCFPTLFLILLINMIWLLMSLWQRSRPAIFLWLLVVMFWMCVVSIEFLIRDRARLY